MDEILRALQRRYQKDGDLETARSYVAQLERSCGVIPDDQRPLDQILMTTLLSHFDDDGINSFAVEATQGLIELVLGEKALDVYQKYLDGAEWRNWINYPQLDQMLLEMNFTCGHSATCERESPCDIVNCQCPGCLQLAILGTNRQLCFHHSELINVYGLERMESEGLRFKRPEQIELDW